MLLMQASLTFAGISKSGSPTLKGTKLGLLAVISKNFANPDAGKALINGETTVLKSNVDIRKTYLAKIYKKNLARKNVLQKYAGRKLRAVTCNSSCIQ